MQHGTICCKKWPWHSEDSYVPMTSCRLNSDRDWHTTIMRANKHRSLCNFTIFLLTAIFVFLWVDFQVRRLRFFIGDHRSDRFSFPFWMHSVTKAPLLLCVQRSRLTFLSITTLVTRLKILCISRKWSLWKSTNPDIGAKLQNGKWVVNKNSQINFCGLVCCRQRPGAH